MSGLMGLVVGVACEDLLVKTSVHLRILCRLAMASSSAFLLFFCLCAAGASAQQWPVPYTEADAMPNLELSLAPPAQPFPEVAAAVVDSEADREALEAESMAKARRALNVALRTAKNKIADVIAKKLSIFDGDRFVFRYVALGAGAVLFVQTLRC
jgi:hypothetical protein